MRGARREHPRQWAVTDEQRSRWPGAAPPPRAGAVWLSGVVARSLQTAGGYARRSRLARQPNSRQQNRNLFLSRPLSWQRENIFWLLAGTPLNLKFFCRTVRDIEKCVGI